MPISSQVERIDSLLDLAKKNVPLFTLNKNYKTLEASVISEQAWIQDLLKKQSEIMKKAWVDLSEKEVELEEPKQWYD